MSTRQKKKEAFAHVMGNVLDFDNNSPMMMAMEELEYESIEDIVTMDKEELKKKLLHALWWRDHEVSLRASMLVTTGNWFQLTAEKVDTFVDMVAANMARGTKTNSDSLSNVTVKQVTDFQRGHKRDLT
eukprot:14527921-Ditylum_brightwellii.AAC.1